MSSSLKKKEQNRRRQLKKRYVACKRKINSLRDVIKELKKSCNLSESAETHLNNIMDGIPRAIMTRLSKNLRSGKTSREKYPSELRQFALTLSFYSSKAYEFVRKTFAFGLPDQSTIRKWATSIDASPGFSKIAFDTLKQIISMSKSPVYCALSFDVMAIKKDYTTVGNTVWGYVSIGKDMEQETLTSNVFVILVTALNASWKIAVGYFFIESLSGRDRANIINEALIRLHENNTQITSVTCDGPTAHITMLKELGCNFDDPLRMKTWFQHPADEDLRIYVLLDVCYMLKLLRNCLAAKGQFYNEKHEIVNWRYIEKLVQIQEEEGLHLANKLKKSHLRWYRQPMKVNLSAQTFSASVAAALQYLKDDLKHSFFKGKLI